MHSRRDSKMDKMDQMNYNNSITIQIENTEITLFYTPQSFFTERRYYDDNNMALCHQHPAHELFVVLNGKMQLTDGIDTITLNQHDVCIVPPKFFHTTFLNSDEPVDRVGLFFIYKKLNDVKYELDFYDIMNRLSMEGMKPILFHISSAYLKILLEVLKNGEEMLTNKDILKIKSILSLLFVTLLEKYENAEPATEALYKRSINFYKRIITLNELLNMRINNQDISMDDISEKLGLSPRHLNNIFSEEYGTSIKNFCYIMRMKQAAFLLGYYPKLTIKEVSDRLGYSSSEIFSIMFKRYYGVSASEYRKKHRLSIKK